MEARRALSFYSQKRQACSQFGSRELPPAAQTPAGAFRRERRLSSPRTPISCRSDTLPVVAQYWSDVMFTRRVVSVLFHGWARHHNAHTLSITVSRYAQPAFQPARDHCKPAAGFIRCGRAHVVALATGATYVLPPMQPEPSDKTRRTSHVAAALSSNSFATVLTERYLLVTIYSTVGTGKDGTARPSSCHP